LAVEADRRLFVAPDNGILSRVFDEAKEFRVVEITNREYALPEIGHTFHGRDIFAPAAAYLARGVHLSLLGPEVHDPVRIGEPAVREEEGALVGQVVSLDHFGNLVTNLRMQGEDEPGGVEVEGRTIPMVRTYGDVPSKTVAALVNSDGRIEVAARDSSAAELLNAGIGTRVLVRLLPHGPAGPEIALA
jgi:S-adenosylmethionine hydrolase